MLLLVTFGSLLMPCARRWPRLWVVATHVVQVQQRPQCDHSMIRNIDVKTCLRFLFLPLFYVFNIFIFVNVFFILKKPFIKNSTKNFKQHFLNHTN